MKTNKIVGLTTHPAAETHPTLCPDCQTTETDVKDSRSSKKFIRRSRECVSCQKRWTTYEVKAEYLETLLMALNKQDEVLGIFRQAKEAFLQIEDSINNHE